MSNDSDDMGPKDEKIDAARRRLMRIAVYTPPVVLGVIVLNDAACAPAPSCQPAGCAPNSPCGPNTCNPVINPCSPQNCNPATCAPRP